VNVDLAGERRAIRFPPPGKKPMDINWKLLAFRRQRQGRALGPANLSAGLPPMIRVDGERQGRIKLPPMGTTGQVHEPDLRDHETDKQAARITRKFPGKRNFFPSRLPGWRAFRGSTAFKTRTAAAGAVFPPTIPPPKVADPMEDLGMGQVFPARSRWSRVGLVVVNRGRPFRARAPRLAADGRNYINDKQVPPHP